jgi:hypothetical protein
MLFLSQNLEALYSNRTTKGLKINYLLEFMFIPLNKLYTLSPNLLMNSLNIKYL